MTLHERIMALPEDFWSSENVLTAMLRDAVLEEREACAKLAVQNHNGPQIANDIRARPKP